MARRVAKFFSEVELLEAAALHSEAFQRELASLLEDIEDGRLTLNSDGTRRQAEEA